MPNTIEINPPPPIKEVFHLEYSGGGMLQGHIRLRAPTIILEFVGTPLPKFDAVFDPFKKDPWSSDVRDQVFESLKTMVSKWLGTETFDLVLTEMSDEIWNKDRVPITLEHIGIPKPKPDIPTAFDQAAEQHRSVMTAPAEYDERKGPPMDIKKFITAQHEAKDIEEALNKAQEAISPKSFLDKFFEERKNDPEFLEAIENAATKIAAEMIAAYKTPFIGQIVHYQCENQPNPFPAIVVSIRTDGKLDLNIFHNFMSIGPSHLIVERDAPYSPTGAAGTWRFIPSS